MDSNTTVALPSVWKSIGATGTTFSSSMFATNRGSSETPASSPSPGSWSLAARRAASAAAAFAAAAAETLTLATPADAHGPAPMFPRSPRTLKAPVRGYSSADTYPSSPSSSSTTSPSVVASSSSSSAPPSAPTSAPPIIDSTTSRGTANASQSGSGIGAAGSRRLRTASRYFIVTGLTFPRMNLCASSGENLCGTPFVASVGSGTRRWVHPASRPRVRWTPASAQSRAMESYASSKSTGR